MEIHRLRDLVRFTDCDLRREATEEQFRFVERLFSEFLDGSNRFEAPGEALFGALLTASDCEPSLEGVCGLNVDDGAGDASAGRVRHLYVRRSHRQMGVGKSLMATVLAAATPHFQLLTLRTESAEADRFYRSLGFERINARPNSTHLLRLGSSPTQSRAG